MNHVILVNENDQEIGMMEKMEVHQKGFLHRAFSVFIKNNKGEILLQQRAFSKYHSAGLWSNACCSHPSPGETNILAAQRRLQEEMGFTCELKELFSFIYRCELENALTEHEFDHVFLGLYQQNPIINKEEVENFKWISVEALSIDLEKYPEKYSYWLKMCWDRVLKFL